MKFKKGDLVRLKCSSQQMTISYCYWVWNQYDCRYIDKNGKQRKLKYVNENELVLI